MNKWLFIGCISIPFLLLTIIGDVFVEEYGVWIFPYSILLVILRRKHLGLKPIFHAPGKDIPKYFTRP